MRLLLCVAIGWLSISASTRNIHADEKWKDALGPSKASIPPALFKSVKWRDDFGEALNLAQLTGLPLLVTWRCLPCKQCAAFDKNVLEGSADLTPLLKRFVTVRLTDAAKLDERYFPYRTHQDLDLSWWAYMLSPNGSLYGVFGGKDHVSDATRISEAAFVNTLKRVLEHHYDPRRDQWDINGPPPAREQSARTPSDSISFEKFGSTRPWLKKQACMHCHQVGDLLNFEKIDAQEFRVEHLVQPWPLPENVGIEVDRDHGLRVTEVKKGSPAASIGIQVGDELAMAGNTKLFGQADLRGALHRASYDEASVPVAWKRNGELHFDELKMKPGWKAAKNSWRKTVYDGIVGPRFGFFPLEGKGNGKGAMSFKPYFGKRRNAPWKAGIRPDMEIIAVNGRSDDWDSRELLAWFRLNHKVGDDVTLKVKHKGNVREITYTLVDE